MKVHPNGRSTEILLAAAESIAVYTKGKAQVYLSAGYPNLPETLSLAGEVENEQTVFGPYASGATIIIDAGPDEVFYSVGTGPVTLEYIRTHQGAPGVLDATGALTAAMILAGIVTSTTAAAVAGTLPTGAVLDATLSMEVGEYFDFSVITTGANAFTVTAAASGHTVVGNMVVAAGKAGKFRTRKTAADTFITYSLSNT